MNKYAYRILLLIEGLLMVWLLYDLGAESTALLLTFIAAGFLFVGFRLLRTWPGTAAKIIGVFLLLATLFDRPPFLLMLVAIVVFVAVQGPQVVARLWHKKEYHAVRAQNVDVRSGQPIVTRNWFGDSRDAHRERLYDSDNIVINVVAGDTILDLGELMLSSDTQIVFIHKGFGNTRIIVPHGVGVLLNHSTLFGDVQFEQFEQQLVNKTISLYSDDYAVATKKIRIVTQCLVGDFEVIRV